MNIEHVCYRNTLCSVFLAQHTAKAYTKSSLQQHYGFWYLNLNVNLNHKINKTIHWKIKLFAISQQPVMLLNFGLICVGKTFEWMLRIQIEFAIRHQIFKNSLEIGT